MFGSYVVYNVFYTSMPSSEQSMIEIHSRIQRCLSEVNLEEYIVSISSEDISHDAKSITSQTSDGDYSMWSNPGGGGYFIKYSVPGFST